jgi:hypothetical protein
MNMCMNMNILKYIKDYTINNSKVYYYLFLKIKIKKNDNYSQFRIIYKFI